MSEHADWMAKAQAELAGAKTSWQGGNAGRGRVGSRRAAGMAYKAALAVEPRPDYGTSFMHHLNAGADDGQLPLEVREASWRLAARPTPSEGWQTDLPNPLTPMADAETVIRWAGGGAEPGSEQP